MVSVPKPIIGQSAVPIIANQDFLSNLIDIVNSWQNGDFGPASVKSRRKGVVMGKNTSGAELPKGTVQQLGALTEPAVANVQPLHEYKPIIGLQDPVWNTSMDKLVILPSPFANNAIRAVGSNQYVPVQLDAAPTVGHGYCHVDPTDPKKLKSGTGGPFKIVSTFANNVAVIDTEQSQNTWQYRIKADDDLDDVELQNLDGTVFANTIKLEFIGDTPTVKADDVGPCINIGSKFYGQTSKGFECEDLCDCVDYSDALPNICPDP